MKKNKALRNLFLFNGIFCFAQALLGPLYAVFVRGINNQIIWVSFAWATGIISTTIFSYILSKNGDRFKNKNLLLLGFIIRGIAWFAFIFVNNIPALLLNMAILGLGEAVGTPAFNSIFAEHLDDGCHVAEYSDWAIVLNISIALGTIVGGIVVSKFGFNPIFIFMSILSLIALFGTYSKSTVYDLETSKAICPSGVHSELR